MLTYLDQISNLAGNLPLGVAASMMVQHGLGDSRQIEPTHLQRRLRERKAILELD